MNKRIRNKINKRIMDKLQNKKEVLTQFEYDYLLKCGPTDLKSMKTNIKIKNGIFVVDGTKMIDREIVSLYADNVMVHQFTNLIDAMDSVDSISYSLENKEANHILFNTDETGSILSAGHGKMPKDEQKTYFKHIVELDDEAYNDESSKWLVGIDVGSEGKELSIVNQAYHNKHSKQFQHSFSDVSNFNFSAPESHHEIQSSVKETKWQKAKGKLKGWFGK